MARVNIILEENLHRRVKSVTALKGITLIKYINQAVAEELKSKTTTLTRS